MGPLGCCSAAKTTSPEFTSATSSLCLLYREKMPHLPKFYPLAQHKSHPALDEYLSAPPVESASLVYMSTSQITQPKAAQESPS